MADYENKIIKAIQMVVDSAVRDAGYDKTIQGVIVKCTDPTIGQYKIRYQDSHFFAYANNNEVSYNDGAEVYVLVPNGDMSREKSILGTVKKLGSNYAPTPEGEDVVESVGTNCISTPQTLELCSYKNEQKVIYDRQQSANLIKLDTKSINEYIKQSSSIICGGVFKNSLATQQQFHGNYGIIFELCFTDNASGQEVLRRYVIDVNQMQGNPYKIPNWKRQYGIFKVDGINFKYVNKISIFAYDFPHQEEGKPADIWIKDFELTGSKPLSAEELQGCCLTFTTPQGIYFDETNLDSDTKSIEAQVRVKGKMIDNNVQKLDFYWFRENVGVTSNSPKYNQYGGQGWECLNASNIISSNPLTIEWVPSTYVYKVAKKDAQALENRYKCVVAYNNIILSKEIIIKNYDSGWEVFIESDQGTDFFFDIGYPSLTCKVKKDGQLINTDALTFEWAEEDNNKNYIALPTTIEYNKEYNNALNGYNILNSKVKNEEILAEAAKEDLDNYLTVIQKYDTITRVEKNNIYKLAVKTITNFSNFKCSVYQNGTYIGTGAIVLTNSLEGKNQYSLVIEEGTQIFKYNEYGVSPTSSSLENPLVLKPLSFTLYDDAGKQIEKENIKKQNIEWIIPTKDTLIDIPDGYGKPDKVDLINNTESYLGYPGITYNINDRYSIKKNRNDIILKVKYKDITYTASTNFTFTKEGDPGTNGTDFICKIVPNDSKNNYDFSPMIITQGNKISLNYTPKNSGKWFRVQLWHNGRRIFNSTETGTTDENKNAIVTWSILKNKYNSQVSDNSTITINAATGVCSATTYSTSTPANIIQCQVKYDNVVYYATLPIITAKINSGYDIQLSAGTGFNFATYTPDGRNPAYNSTLPFEIKVFKNINNKKEDISTLNKNSNRVSYSWNLLGKIYNVSNKQWENNINLAINKNIKDLLKNQYAIKPVDDFNGECLNNALECVVKNTSNQEVARIHLPIHLMLNRYGNAAINGWNGNSVSIDSEGGVILSPQVGAGRKESDNSFTGVLIGEAKESTSARALVGLLGYAKGVRSIFLDAETGKAEFGANGKGQIIIDPTKNKAQIYSGNYSTSKKTGMLIDLTTPKIEFGSGNFKVDANGYITAKGGGTIAGWHIDSDSLYTNNKSDSDNVRISSVDFSRTVNGISRSYLRLALGKKFAVSSSGTMYAGDAIIGTGTNKITIGKSSADGAYSAIYSGSKKSFAADASGFYIGTDGIALGNYNSNGESKFQVTSQGILTVREGHVGNWTITRNTIQAGNIILNSNGSMSGGNNSGGTWTIAQNGTATFNKIYASTSGQIGGWTISGTKLTGGNTTINSNGNIECSGGNGWYIHNDGSARFGNMSISTNGSITANGGTFNNITATGGTFNSIVVSGSAKIPADTVTGVLSTGNIPNLSAGKITSGTMSANRISGGTLSIYTNGGGYLKAGVNTTHVDVSGINTGGHGIAMNGSAGISGCTGASNTGGSAAYTCGADMTVRGDQHLYLRGGNAASNILIYTSSGFRSINALFVTYQGNGAQLGNLWVGDHVINDSSGSQIDMLSNLDLYSAKGKVVRANGSQIGPSNSTLNVKRNIRERDLSELPDILRQIKIYDYNYIKEFYNGKKSYGYIIDYLEKIPGLSKYFTFRQDNRDKKHPSKILSSQEDFTKFLLSAVVELQKEIDEIKGDKKI